MGQEKSELNNLIPRKVISEIEFMVGASLISPPVDPAINRNTKLGLIGGIGLTHQFNSRFSINAKVSYEQKGMKSSISSLNEDYNPPDVHSNDYNQFEKRHVFLIETKTRHSRMNKGKSY